MFQHLLSRRERQPPGDRHRLAGGGGSGDGSQHPPSTRLAPSRLGGGTAEACSPRSQQQQGTGGVRHRMGPLPVCRSRLDRHVGRRRHLPHVQPPAERPPVAYTSLEGLRCTGELFKGKHSTVCTYVDTSTGAVVAVKTYYKRTMAKRHFRNVRREVAISRMLARQRFTGAVQLLGAFEDEEHIYLVQESCTGGDLYRRLVRAGGLMAEADVCRDVVVPLLLTLTFLHANHIVHRDIKPENIMFAADGGLRLGDFGLSIDARLERPTSRVGTLDYMAPEVVGMPSPDEIQRRNLAPHQIGHYGCKVDVWAVGILTYELICGRPPFEVEDVKLTEQLIKFADVDFPQHVSPACRSFIQQALTKRPESRSTAAQLFQHPWVQECYQRLLADQAQHAAAPTAALAQTPELRRTASQPPSPSKSMPEDAAGRPAGTAVTPAGVAAALAPFLPLSQAKMAHKVRILSPGRPASARAARARRRVSDPVARLALTQPDAAGAGAAGCDEAAAWAAEAGTSIPVAPPRTPPPSSPFTGSDGSMMADAAAAAGDGGHHTSSMGQAFETPGTPGLKTTPLPRQRPVPSAQQRSLLGRTPFLLSLASPFRGGSSAASPGGSTASVAAAELQPLGSRAGAAGAGHAAPQRSRFAAENDESLSLRESAEAVLSSPVRGSRSSSFTSLAKDGSGSLELAARSNSFASFGGSSTGNLQLAARAGSFSSFGGGGSSSNLQLAARAGSFSSFGGGSSGSLSGLGMTQASSCSPVSKARSRQQLLEGQADEAPAPAALRDRLQRLQLA